MQAVIAELLAVIGGDHDQRVVPRARGVQRVPQPTELMIDLADHPEVLGAQAPERRRIGRRGGLRVAQQRLVVPMTPIGRHRFDRVADLVGVVGRRPLPRRAVRRMRPQVAGVGEPRLVLAPEPGEHPLGEERRAAVLGRATGLAAQHRLVVVGHVVTEVAQPLDPRGVRPREVHLDVEAGQDPPRLAAPRIAAVGHQPRVDALVGVAEQRRRVPGTPGDAGDVVEAVVERRAVGHHPVVHLVRAGVQRRPPGAHGVAWL